MVKYTGLSLHPTLHDIYMEEWGALAVVHETHAIGQLIKQRLKTYRGEWFLDMTVGQPWFSHQDRQLIGILDVPYNGAVAEALIKAAILSTTGVVELTSFIMEPRFNNRELAVIDVDVLTEFDEIVAISI